MKWLFLLRAFFPSWRFFDEAGSDLILQTRYRDSGGAWSAWANTLPPVPRRWLCFPLNPKASYLHACQNSLEHLAADAQRESGSLNERPSFNVVRAMALYELRQAVGLPVVQAYQFRILAGLEGDAPEEFLLSPEYSV